MQHQGISRSDHVFAYFLSNRISILKIVEIFFHVLKGFEIDIGCLNLPTIQNLSYETEFIEWQGISFSRNLFKLVFLTLEIFEYKERKVSK